MWARLSVHTATPEGTLWLAPLGLKKTIKESQTNRQSWLLSGKAIRYA